MDIEVVRQRLIKTGRNDPCPCGSGRKYKKCCLAADETQVREAKAPTQTESGPQPADAAREPDEADPGGDLELLEDESGDYNDDAPANPAVDAVWDAFDALKRPTTAEMDAHLERLLALPTDETQWNELFHLFAEKGHEDLPAVFRRIDSGVKPTRKSAPAYFYWVALEEFVGRGCREMVPEVLAGMRRLDADTYEAGALRHIELWALAAGCEPETLALVEHFLPVLRADRKLMPHAAPESARMVFHLRLGRALRTEPGEKTEPAALAKALLRGLSRDIAREYAELAAAAILHPGSQPEPTRQDFVLPSGADPVEESALRRRFLALLAVARDGWEAAGRPPGIALHGLWLLVDAAFEERRDWPERRRRDPIDLVASLQPSGMERRIATASWDLLGTNRPLAHLLTEAHADLLRFAVRHHLVERPQAEKSERQIAFLRGKIGLPG